MRSCARFSPRAVALALPLCLAGCSGQNVGSPTNRETGTSANTTATDKETATTPTDHHYFHETEQPPLAAWGYTGPTGPEHWGDLCPEYALAKTGKRQSPIDISSATGEDLPPLRFDYVPAKIDLVYNGHTVEETEEAGSSITTGDHTFALEQFHFHEPSEHTIDGRHAAMEMHLVHKDEEGHVAVVGVLIDEGEHNAAFDPIWNYLPTEENKRLLYEATIDPATLLPTERSYYEYTGSFTTPPCTEPVTWFVLTEPVELSTAQIDKFKAIISGNNRPVQPLNGREIVRSPN